MKIENPFTVNMQVNKHNLDVMIDELKKLACEFDFCNTRINKTLLSLYLMRKHLNKLKNDKYTSTVWIHVALYTNAKLGICYYRARISQH